MQPLQKASRSDSRRYALVGGDALIQQSGAQSYKGKYQGAKTVCILKTIYKSCVHTMTSCAFVLVCIYVYAYIYIYMYMYMYMHMYMYLCIHTYMYMYTHMHRYTYIHTHIKMYIYTHNAYIPMYV